MGFAQKGGAVLSFVRVAETLDLLNQVRIDTQQADIVLACDMVVGASPDALGTVKHGRTQIIANAHEIATAAFVRNADATLHADALLAKMRFAAGEARVRSIDAQAICQELLGDTLPSNIVMLGAAWQAGCVPVSLAALQRAIELNGVAVDVNKAALALGRLALAAPEALRRLSGGGVVPPFDAEQLDGDGGLIARRSRHLQAYGGAAYLERYQTLVARVRAAESTLSGASQALTHAVAFNFAKLLAIKDEYEVARLHRSFDFDAQLRAQFESWERINFHLAPPLLARRGPDGKPQKMRFGPWVQSAFAVLAKMRGLRGTALDVFGHTQERRIERSLISDYEQRIGELLPGLDAKRLPLAVLIARVPESIRGYGHVKLASVATAQARWGELMDRWHGRDVAPEVAQRKVIALRQA